MQPIKSFASPASLVCLGLLAAASFVAPGAAANPAYDGNWRVSVQAETGACLARYTVPIRVDNGSVSYAGAFSAEASGRVNPAGKLNVSFSHKDKVVDVSGSLNGGIGQGSWTSPTENCGGTWSARRA